VVVYILPFSLTGYSEKYFEKLMGNREIEDSLERLDRLTQEEARMASAEQLKMTHSVDDRVRGVEGRVQDVHDGVQDVRGDVQDVGNKVQDVEDRVQGMDSNVRGVDDKLDQASRSSSLETLITILQAQTTSQATSSETVFYAGFRHQIHPPIITSPAKPITTARLNGFSKRVYSINGNPMTRFCGYTENVRYS
jgi:hypothetical protein